MVFILIRFLPLFLTYIRFLFVTQIQNNGKCNALYKQKYNEQLHFVIFRYLEHFSES